MTTNGSDLIIQQKVQWVQELLGLTNNVDLNVCNEQSLNSKLDLAPATDTSSSDNITPQSSQPIALVEADSTEKCRLANDEMRERMEVIGDPSTADKMGTQPKKVRQHQIHPRKGALAPVNQAFCPLDAVSKYPYLFVPAQVSEPIAEKFFNDGKFWHRKWDIYYVWPPVSITSKPAFVVPVEQVEQLLHEIYNAFDRDEAYYLVLGSDASDFGLVMEFPQHPTLRPRLLGESNTREEFGQLKNNVPNPDLRLASEPNMESEPTEDESIAFTRLLTKALQMARHQLAARNRDRNQGKSKRKKEEQVQRAQNWKNELRRCERLLGLRPSSAPLAEPPEGASWAEIQEYHAMRDHHRKLDPIDPDQVPPHDFENLPIFLSVDVECYEADKSKVTEIGVAMLDTALLKDCPPGRHGVNWRDKIKARHFRIREHLHLKNGKHVADAADKFQFPQDGSELVELEGCATVLRSCFAPPYCHVNRPWLDDEIPDGVREDSDVGSSNTVSQESEASISLQGKHVRTFTDSEQPKNISENHKNFYQAFDGRNLVLVGHDIDSDIRYLRKLDVDLENLGTMTTIDTANLYRAHAQELNPRSLSGLLSDFEMIGWHPHNAGNDAVHTVWVMIALTLQHTMERGDQEIKKRRRERREQQNLEAILHHAIGVHEQGSIWEERENRAESIEHGQELTEW